jgi:hypothetical protein
MSLVPWCLDKNYQRLDFPHHDGGYHWHCQVNVCRKCRWEYPKRGPHSCKYNVRKRLQEISQE